ncbi:MAG: ABC transporter ATP-binding protein [Alphaproteobacteria bacterium]
MTRTPERETVGFFGVLKFAWAYWRRHPLVLAVLGVSLLIMTAAQVSLPVLSGRLIDIVSADASAPENARAGAAVAAFIGLMLLLDVTRNTGTRFLVWFATKCMSRLLNDAFRRVQRFSTDWHANNFAGATVRKMTRGMWAFDAFEDSLYFGFIPASLVIGGIMIVLALQWPVMGLFIAGSVAAYVAVLYLVTTRYVAPINRQFAGIDSRLGGVLADAVTCNATVKAFGAEKREDGFVGSVIDEWRVTGNRTWWRHVDLEAVQAAILIFMQGGLLALAWWFWTRGLATPGQVTQVIVTYFIMSGYLRDLGMHMRNLQQAVNEIEDVVLFKEHPLGVEDASPARAFRPGSGRIAFDRVTFAYARQQRPVYRDFSLEIAAGEQVALVGHSGSGKSTFVKLVQRLYDVNEGRILIDGQDIARVTQESLRRAIALVPQEPILFHRSLAENIAYGKPGASQADIRWAARRARAHEFIMGLSDGYDTLVGERGVKLSGGERQRIAIARAFLADAPVLILDEATSSLDSVTEAQIQAAIEELMEGRTTILIAHRLSTIRSVDRILVFRDGRIVEQGTHEELAARAGGHYRELYATQTGARKLATAS